jgi:hypothetical protein
VPAPQLVQLTAPVVLAYWPAAQLVQLALALLAAYSPARHV